jgi:hypothetical protein
MAGMTTRSALMVPAAAPAPAIVAQPPAFLLGAVGGRSRMAGPDLCPAGH